MTCDGDCPKCLDPSRPAPSGVEIRAGDIFIKEMAIAVAGTPVLQHAHAYDHVSYVARGRVRLWKDGRLSGDYSAPVGLFIPAGVLHEFLSLVDDTLVLCVHSLHGEREVRIAREHPVTESV